MGQSIEGGRQRCWVLSVSDTVMTLVSILFMLFPSSSFNEAKLYLTEQTEWKLISLLLFQTDCLNRLVPLINWLVCLQEHSRHIHMKHSFQVLSGQTESGCCYCACRHTGKALLHHCLHCLGDPATLFSCETPAVFCGLTKLKPTFSQHEGG